MTEPVIKNVRKAKCNWCKKELAPGEGYRHEMFWCAANNPYYYLCEKHHDELEKERADIQGKVTQA
jgi:hypothetical protein